MSKIQIFLVTFWGEAEKRNADTKKKKSNCKSLTRKMNSPRFYYTSQKLSIAAVKMEQMILLECLSEDNTTASNTKWDTTYLWARNTACTTELAVFTQHMKSKKEIQRIKRN